VTAARLRAAGLVLLAALWAVAAYFLWDTKVPGDLRLPDVAESSVLGPRALDRAEDYERFVRLNAVLSQVALVVGLALYAWRGERFMRESAAGRIGTGMLLGMLGLAIVWLVQLPFGLTGHWWDRRYGLSDVGYLDWALQGWLGLAGAFLFICLALLIVMVLAGALGNRWWLAAAPAFVGLGVLFAFVYPYLLTDLHELRRPELAADARQLARQQGVEEIEVRVEDMSDFTSAPNAYAAGVGPSRRVVLWDTLLDGPFSREEIRVVLAHEFGHHSGEHIWKGLAWYALFALPGTFLIARATRRRGGMYYPAAVPLSLLVLVVLQLLLQPVQNVISRRMEAEADWTALEATRDPDAARTLFRKFATTALAEPEPPVWAYVLLDTHPTLVQRIEMAEAWRDRNR
jgi:STE24 endopeptidase